MRKLILLISMGLALVSPAQKTVEDRIAFFDDGLAKAEADYTRKDKIQNLKYMTRLDELKAWYQNRGNLDGVVSVQSELKRFEADSDLEPADVVKVPNELARVQTTALGSMIEHDEKIFALRKKVRAAKLQVLEERKVELTKLSKVDEAIVYQKRIEALKRTPLDPNQPEPEAIVSTPFFGTPLPGTPLPGTPLPGTPLPGTPLPDPVAPPGLLFPPKPTTPAAPSLSSTELNSLVTVPEFSKRLAVPPLLKNYALEGSWSLAQRPAMGKPVELVLNRTLTKDTKELVFTFEPGYKTDYTYKVHNWPRSNEYVGREVSKRFKATRARFLRYDAGIDIQGNAFTSLAEFNALGSTGIPLDRSGWKVVKVSSQATGKEDSTMFTDGDPGSWWHSSWQPMKRPPHSVIFDMGQTQIVTGVSLRMRNDGLGNGIPAYCMVYASSTPSFDKPILSERVFDRDLLPFEVYLKSPEKAAVRARLIQFKGSFNFQGKKSGAYRFAIPPGMDPRSMRINVVQLNAVGDYKYGLVLRGE